MSISGIPMISWKATFNLVLLFFQLIANILWKLLTCPFSYSISGSVKTWFNLFSLKNGIIYWRLIAYRYRFFSLQLFLAPLYFLIVGITLSHFPSMLSPEWPSGHSLYPMKLHIMRKYPISQYESLYACPMYPKVFNVHFNHSKRFFRIYPAIGHKITPGYLPWILQEHVKKHESVNLIIADIKTNQLKISCKH